MGKDLSCFLQWKPNIALIQKMGWPMAFKYTAFLGSLYYLAHAGEKRKILDSIGNAFAQSMDPLTFQTLKRKVFKGILHHYCEKLFNAYESLPNLKAFFEESIEAPSRLYKIDDALRGKKGLLFVTAHFGGIEYIPIFLSLRGYPVSVVIKCATDHLKERLQARAKELHIRVIDAEQHSILGEIIRELRRNRIVFTECDEIDQWKPSKTEQMLFLGKKIGVDKTINLIQRRSGAKVVFGLLHRISMEKYSFILKDSDDLSLRGEGPNSSVGAALLGLLEQYICLDPQNWYQWKKFSTFPALNDLPPQPHRFPAFAALGRTCTGAL